MDYFELLGLKRVFKVDLGELERAYFSFQRKTHPDRYASAPEEEREKALKESIVGNAAYNTLREPLARAEYMLELVGMTLAAEKSATAELLAEVMEYQEEIAFSKDLAMLTALKEQLAQALRLAAQCFAEEYAKEEWLTASSAAVKMKYYSKLLHEIDERIGALLN